MVKAYQLFAVECEGRYQLVYATDWSEFDYIQIRATVLSTDRCTTSSVTFSAEHANFPFKSMRLCQNPVVWYAIPGSLEAKALPSFPGTIWVSTAEP